MKKKLGNFFLILGGILLLAVVAQIIWNLNAARQSSKSASNVVSQMHNLVGHKETSSEDLDPSLAENGLSATPGENGYISTEEVVVDIDGYGYIGYLTFPTLDLQLPVMSEWDYTRLKVAPCRYVGTVATDDIVIAAHNNRHFGPINDLALGDSVIFTDMNGVSIHYEVVESGILASTAIEEMTSGEFDLTLFTCTIGGKSRVTVRCNRTEAE